MDDEGIPIPGEVVLDKYRVERTLGRGGMGVVLAATHLTLDQRVAIKFLLASAAEHPQSHTRFIREARAAARIQSDHVAKVSDVGTLPNGVAYMVMEYLDGENLADLLARVGRLSVDQAARYLLQACEALAEAHREGIVHRDLKPANLFLARRPDGTSRIKVLDFGISKILPGSSAQGQHDLTNTAALMGSPLYMAPEQMKSAKAADTRSDVWALGSIAFELVAGEPPFNGTTLPEICTRILTAEPPPLASLVHGVPEGFAEAVHRCLDKEPETRLQTIAELAEWLAPFGGEEALRSLAVVRRVAGVAAPVEQPPVQQPPVQQPPVVTASQAPRASSPLPLATIPADDGEAAATPPAMAGASTSAGLAQTMIDGSRSRRKGLGVALAGLAVAAIGATVLVLGRSNAEGTWPTEAPAPSPAASAPTPTAASADVTGDIDATPAPTGSDRASQPAAPQPSAPQPVASSTAAPAASARPPASASAPAKTLRPPLPTAPPRPPRPTPPPRTGDDLFDTYDP